MFELVQSRSGAMIPLRRPAHAAKQGAEIPLAWV
jgi:hypothetical protein